MLGMIKCGSTESYVVLISMIDKQVYTRILVAFGVEDKRIL